MVNIPHNNYTVLFTHFCYSVSVIATSINMIDTINGQNTIHDKDENAWDRAN